MAQTKTIKVFPVRELTGRITWAYQIDGRTVVGDYLNRESAKIAAEKEADRQASFEAATLVYEYMPARGMVGRP